MEISFKSYHECNILESIIKDYEDRRDSEKRIDSAEFNHVIGRLRSAIDAFKIDKVFDYIGPLHCISCHHGWTAVVGKEARKMICPNCDEIVIIPPEKFVRQTR